MPPDDQLDLREIAHQLADSHSEWWPFAFLRPVEHERFTSVRCALLALLYGLPAALFAVVGGKLAGDHVEGIHLLLFPLCVCAVLFAAFRIWIASFWNRRAQRLRQLHERRIDWQRSLEDD
jgi:hypothetical protein